jgi:hypothetical protein
LAGLVFKKRKLGVRIVYQKLEGFWFCCWSKNIKQKARFQPWLKTGLKKIPGGVLLSHPAAQAVPSAQKGLTSVFEMGTGVAPSPLPPGKGIIISDF